MQPRICETQQACCVSHRSTRPRRVPQATRFNAASNSFASAPADAGFWPVMRRPSTITLVCQLARRRVLGALRPQRVLELVWHVLARIVELLRLRERRQLLAAHERRAVAEIHAEQRAGTVTNSGHELAGAPGARRRPSGRPRCAGCRPWARGHRESGWRHSPRHPPRTICGFDSADETPCFRGIPSAPDPSRRTRRTASTRPRATRTRPRSPPCSRTSIGCATSAKKNPVLRL